MADKDFGVKKISFFGSDSTPAITSPTDLNINANKVAISTDATVGGNLGIGTTNPTAKLWVNGDGYFVGVVTATKFVGALDANFAQAQSVGFATTAINLAGGAAGSLPFQNSSGITSFLSGGSNNQVLLYDTGTNKPKWGNVSAGEGAFSGITVRDEGTTLFTDITTLDIFGSNIAVISGGAGISSIRVSDTLVGTSLSISGISTLGTVSISSGIVSSTTATAVTFIGNLTGTASYATTAGIATNLAGGSAGSLPFQNSSGITSFLSGGSNNQVLLYDTGTNKPKWGSAGDAQGSFGGIDVKDEDNSQVSGIKILNIRGDNISAVSDTVSGISTITVASNLVGTSLSISGISTFNTVRISSGIVSSTTATAVTFIGNLTGTSSYATTAGIASAVKPNSVALGTDTTGDYVQSISGTANQITVTGGTGEGSTPVISIPTNPTLPGTTVTIQNDLQVNRNLNVSGNITIGGTTALLDVQRLQVSDSDLVLGVRTDAFGNDVSNDTTANHGGIAIASTEGSPLVNLNVAGIETLAPTYKKIMWFKSGTFAGLGTDAWLFNYAVGIGSTQFPAGTRLAVGSVQFTENDLSVVRNINATGVITATKFSGQLDATSAIAQSVGFATTAINLAGGVAGNVPYQSSTNNTNFVINPGVSGKVLLFNGSVPVWGDVSAATGSFGGITVQDEGTQVGTGSSIVTLNFVGSNIKATATTGASGIATITMSDNIVGTSLSISGISTFGGSNGVVIKLDGSNGIVTSANPGVTTVTYYGDGSQLTGLTAGVSISTNTTNQSQFLTYVTGTGSTAGFGVTTTGLVFNPSTRRLGIGTNTLTTTLNIGGALGFTNNNIRIGDANTGCSITSGKHNFFAGVYAGRCNTTGSYNNFFGRDAGTCNNTGYNNNFFGLSAGKSNTTGCNNNFFGRDAGTCNNTGYYNNFFGLSAGRSNTTGYENNFLGFNAGSSNITGSGNNFIGRQTGYCNTGGYFNNFLGYLTGLANTTGSDNNFIGRDAGRYNTSGCYNNFFGKCAGGGSFGGNCNTGSNNNFFGNCAGRCNTTGCFNNFFGYNAGRSNTTANSNNMIGQSAGYCNTTGHNNVFMGTYVGYSNTTGCYNNFFGRFAGRYSTSGNNNNFMGTYAGGGSGSFSNTGSNNNFFGYNAGFYNTTGSNNNFFGNCAGRCNTTGCFNNFFGNCAGRCNTTGSCNIFLGNCAACNQTAGNRNVAIGFDVQLPITTESDQLNIGSGSNSWIIGNSSFNVGIGTTNPTSKLWVNGDGYFVGVVTSSGFYVNGELIGGSITGSNLVGTALSVSGISTLGTVKISSGTITATSGVVTYYGDGSQLTGLTAGVSISTNTTNQSQFLTYVTGTGTTTGFGVTTTGLVFNPSTRRLGIGTNTLTTTLNIGGALGFTNNNIRIGDANTGCSITSGKHNFFAGVYAGTCNTTGCNNNFFGQNAGYGKIGVLGAGSFHAVTSTAIASAPWVNYYNLVATGGTGSGATFNLMRYDQGQVIWINVTTGGSGYTIGDTLTIDGSLVGGVSGTDNVTFTINNLGQDGSNNNFFGKGAGLCNALGSSNNFFGYYTGKCNICGNFNNFFGSYAGGRNTTGSNNNFFGYNAGFYNTTGVYNNFFGYAAGNCNTNGQDNNFFGLFAGCKNTTGSYNNFFGREVGKCNTTGYQNNFFGAGAGSRNASGCNNNYFGCFAGGGLWYSSTTSCGCNNNFFGQCAGIYITTGTSNNFFGFNAGRCISTGSNNNFFGLNAGLINTTGNYNNFFGRYAGRSNTTANSNNFFGQGAGFCNTTGHNNVFMGTYVGYRNTTGSCNIFLGYNAACTQTSGDRNVALGSGVQLPITTGSDQLNIGSGSNSWISGNSSFNVGIGTTNPTQSLHILGNARVTGAFYDSTNAPGTTGQVLQSTATGTLWATAAAGGGSGKFDTSIDNVLYVQPTGTLDIVGVGTTTTQITTLPSGSNKYLVHSLHVTNVSNGDAEITAGFVLNARKVSATISVSVGSSGGPGIHTFTVGSASSITVGMAVTGTGNIGETTGIGSTAGFQFNTYVTSVDGNNITLSKPMSGLATGVLYFSPVSKISSRLPVPVGSAVELLKQPMVLNALDSIVLQSTGAGTGIGSTSTAAISQTANSNFLTVTAGAAITNFLASGMLIQPTGNNTGIQTNTFVGVGYIPGSLSIPITRPTTSTLASQSLSFTEVITPQDGALQVTVVYQSSTDTSYQNGTGTVVGIVTLASQASSRELGITSTTPSVYYGTGTVYPSVVQSIRVSNISDGIIYPGGDYPVSVGIGNSDTIFSWLAYNMIIPKNSSIELCEAPKRLGIGQSIFASSSAPNAIEIQIAGKQKTT